MDIKRLSRLIFSVCCGLCLASSAPSAQADQLAVLIGGSGEDMTGENRFTKDFVELKQNLKNLNWQVDTVFDSDTSQIPGSVQATNPNIIDSLNKVTITAKKGDEVLLFFHSHGSGQRKEQLTHSIVSETPHGFNMDDVQDTLAALHDKGVKVALVDLSCYSGNTQILANDSCVVTLAAAKYVSVCSKMDQADTFTNEFIKIPKKGTSIQDQFLKARRADQSSTNLPQISSLPLPAQGFWDLFLPGSDPNSVFREKNFGQNEEALKNECDECLETAKFEKQLDQFKEILNSLNNSQLKKEALDAYQSYMDTESQLEKVTGDLQVYFRSHNNWYFTEPALKGLNSASPAAIEQILFALSSPKPINQIAWLSPEEKESLNREKPYMDLIDDRYEKLFLGAGPNWKKYQDLSAKLAAKGQRLMEAERKAYDLYQKQSDTRNDSLCQDFKF